MSKALDGLDLLERYNFYQNRLDKANEATSKTFEALVNIISQLAKIEGEIKGI